ncbi:MAG: hypothetical protein ACFFAX_10700 [Promethearchaeota archaeon]
MADHGVTTIKDLPVDLMGPTVVDMVVEAIEAIHPETEGTIVAEGDQDTSCLSDEYTKT